MHITLINEQEHAFLLDAFALYSNLVLQNKGYETLNRDKLTPNDKVKIKEIEALLKKSIKGFQEFTNFRLTKDGEPEIRFQYDWHDGNSLGYDPHFIGVGYIKIDELLHGFDADKNPEQIN